MAYLPRIAVPRWRASTWERTSYYIDSLRWAGGQPMLLGLADPFEGLDGLLLTGGADIDPKLYAEHRGPETDRANRRRDAHELGLLRQAVERDLPVLAICRGHQLLNVALGGSLLQHIEGHRADENGDSAWHDVALEPGSRLARACDGSRRLRVNSRHHQAVTPERLAPGLAVVGAADGYAEAVESRDRRWVLGVQWHPERPEIRPTADRLFRAFVEACRR